MLFARCISSFIQLHRCMIQSENQQAPLLHASQSFKVLVECPIATVLFTNEPDQSISKYSSILVPASIKVRRRTPVFCFRCVAFTLFSSSYNFRWNNNGGLTKKVRNRTTCGLGSHRISRIVLLIPTSSGLRPRWDRCPLSCDYSETRMTRSCRTSPLSFVIRMNSFANMQN